jgi:hypothetical protein
MGLSFTIAAGPRQRSHSRVRICFRFAIPQTWMARYACLHPTGTGSSPFTPRHCVPFSLLLTIRLTGLRWRYSNPPPHGYVLPVAICYLVAYLTTMLSVSRLYSTMIGWLMNEDMEILWKEAAFIIQVLCRNVWSDWGKLRKICHGGLYPGRHSNRAPPEYRPTVLSLDHPARCTHCSSQHKLLYRQLSTMNVFSHFKNGQESGA